MEAIIPVRIPMIGAHDDQPSASDAQAGDEPAQVGVGVSERSAL